MTLERIKPFARVRIDGPDPGQQKNRASLNGRAPYTASELIKVGEPERLRVRDKYRIGPRYVYSRFNDCR